MRAKSSFMNREEQLFLDLKIAAMQKFGPLNDAQEASLKVQAKAQNELNMIIEAKQAIAESITGNLESAFNSIVDGSKSAKEAFKDMAKAILADIARMIVGVAGTFTSLASIYLKQDRFNEEEIHLTEISDKDVFEINNSIMQMTEAQIITNFKGVDPKRAKTIQSGILLANQIISKYNVNSIKVSNSDILEGLILKKY